MPDRLKTPILVIATAVLVSVLWLMVSRPPVKPQLFRHPV